MLLPIAGVISMLFVKHRAACRWVTLGISLAVFVLSLLLLIPFDWHRGTSYGYAKDRGSMQLVQDLACIRQFNIHYKVGIDGLSLPLIFLTTFIMPIVVIASWKIDKMVRAYLFLLLILESAVLGVFLSIDLFQFYLFFETSLLAIYLLIRICGAPGRKFGTIKFLVYSAIGSIAMLTAVIGIYHFSRQVVHGGTFDLIELAQPAFQTRLGVAMGGPVGTTARGLLLMLMFGFAVRLSAVPFHGWLRAVHTQSPTPISMVMTALILKLGGYGILRVAYPLFPQAAKTLWMVFAITGLISLIFGGLCALAQRDFKRVIAYSSISHMGMIILGAAMMTPAGTNGALYMMIADGLTSAMLFFIVGVIHDRVNHHDINRLGGLAAEMPIFTGFSMVAFFSNLGLPGLCGFVAQLLVVMGIFQAARPDSALYHHAVAMGELNIYLITVRVIAGIACASLIVTAGGMLWAFQRIYLGPARSDRQTPADANRLEVAVMVPLATMVILFGILPAFFVFALSNPTVAGIFKLF